MDIFSTENSSFSLAATSPRISFSHNLDDETYPSPSPSPSVSINPKSDSDFCFTADLIMQTEASSADELFCNGLILPNYDSKHVSSSTPSIHAITDQHDNLEISEEIVSCDGNQSKSFWRIKRSTSLHFETTKLKTSSFWSSLPLLSRSNSTGSVAKDRQNKQNHQLQKQIKNSAMAVYSSSMKPPLKRNHGGAYDYGTRISPVLNVPPPFVSKSAANLLGLGSFFGHGIQDQKNKKP